MKEEKQDKLKSSRKLLGFVRVFRYLPIVAIAEAVIVLCLLLFLTLETPYSSSEIIGLLLLTIVVALTPMLLREKRAPRRPRITLNKAMVLQELLREGAKVISRKGGYAGARVIHQPDVVFEMNGRTYIAEIKTRPLVPSDIDNASRILEDVKSIEAEIHGVVLFTSISPPISVLEMAKSRNVGIRIFPRLSTTDVPPLQTP